MASVARCSENLGIAFTSLALPTTFSPQCTVFTHAHGDKKLPVFLESAVRDTPCGTLYREAILHQFDRSCLRAGISCVNTSESSSFEFDTLLSSGDLAWRLFWNAHLCERPRVPPGCCGGRHLEKEVQQAAKTLVNPSVSSGQRKVEKPQAFKALLTSTWGYAVNKKKKNDVPPGNQPAATARSRPGERPLSRGTLQAQQHGRDALSCGVQHAVASIVCV